MTRLLICGDREWKDKEYILQLLRQRPDVIVVIEGECRGADTLGRLAAKALKIPVDPFPADWRGEGKAAGPLRNQRMLDVAQPTEVWAFHDGLPESKGTRDMVNRAIWSDIPTWLFWHWEKQRLTK